MSTDHCTACGATEPGTVATAPDYHLWPSLRNGLRLCLPCAVVHETVALRDRTRPHVAYLSGDGKQVTGWLGNRLMDVVQTWQVASNWWHVGKLTYVLARDVHGQWWYGRGAGTCMAIIMRPRKHAPANWLVGKGLALAAGLPAWERLEVAD